MFSTSRFPLSSVFDFPFDTTDVFQPFQQPLQQQQQQPATVFPAVGISRHVEPRVMTTAEGQTVWRPATDIFETDNEIVVHVDLPGVSKEEVNVDMVKNELVISGSHKGPEGFESATCRVRERKIGRFRKIVQLPSGVKPDNIQAKCENGLLEIKLPKPSDEQAGRHHIQLG